jgi:hypothetical protein
MHKHTAHVRGKIVRDRGGICFVTLEKRAPFVECECLEIVQVKAVSQFEPITHACYVLSREMKKQRHQKCRVEETNPVSPSFAPGFFFTSKQSFSHIQKMSSMHVPSPFLP